MSGRAELEPLAAVWKPSLFVCAYPTSWMIIPLQNIYLDPNKTLCHSCAQLERKQVDRRSPWYKEGENRSRLMINSRAPQNPCIFFIFSPGQSGSQQCESSQPKQRLDFVESVWKEHQRCLVQVSCHHSILVWMQWRPCPTFLSVSSTGTLKHFFWRCYRPKVANLHRKKDHVFPLFCYVKWRLPQFPR